MSRQERQDQERTPRKYKRNEGLRIRNQKNNGNYQSFLISHSSFLFFLSLSVLIILCDLGEKYSNNNPKKEGFIACYAVFGSLYFSHWFSRHKQTQPKIIRGTVQTVINIINHIITLCPFFITFGVRLQVPLMPKGAKNFFVCRDIN